MRDLEIRGAGSLLGESQSGHIAAVGYDLYVEMVNQAVAELKGETPRSRPRSRSTCRWPPTSRRTTCPGGPPHRGLPPPRRRHHPGGGGRHPGRVDRPLRPAAAAGRALLEVAKVRAECARLGVTEVTVAAGPGFGGPAYIARLTPVALKVSQEVRLKRLVKGAVYKPDTQQLQLPVIRKDALAEGIVALLQELVPPVAEPRRQ